MRPTILTLAALMLAAPPLVAQNPPPKGPPPAAAPAPAAPTGDPRLDSLMRDWEKKMKAVEQLAAKCQRHEIEALRGRKQVFTGEALLLKPNLFKLDLTNDAAKDDRELYVSNGNMFYEYRVKDKLVRVHELPKNGAVADDNFLSLLFGMKVADAMKRYDINIHKFEPNDFYVYLAIRPRQAADKQEFTEAQLALWSPDIGKLHPNRADWALLPARLWFKSPSGSEVTWLLTHPNTQTKLEKAHFVPPSLPKDWRVEKGLGPQPANGPAPKGPTSPGPQGNLPPTKVRQ